MVLRLRAKSESGDDFVSHPRAKMGLESQA